MKSLLLIGFLLTLSLPAYAEEEYKDGTYDATVTTESGSYTVPVEVEDGEVTGVYWPNGGQMHVMGGDLDGTSASGSSYDGRWVDVEIDE